MKHPVWLAELHRQWFAARGKKLGTRSRPYSKPWHELLDAAGVRTAEDEATAEREARKLHEQNKVELTFNKYRIYRIEQIRLPLEAEPWLRTLFDSRNPEELRDQSIAHVRAALGKEHPLHPALWKAWLQAIQAAFQSGHVLAPLSWRHPELVAELLELTYQLTATEWPGENFAREASVQLGLPSKQLERSQRVIEACLRSMFGRPFTLEDLGILGCLPRSEISGDLQLHFSDGHTQQLDELKGLYSLTSDLIRASKAETSAKRILTVENSRTTLRRLATLNADRETLIVACAYPSRGLMRLLELLPPELPVFHFGDTDPAGFQILSKLRRAIGRPVTPFLMKRRVRERPVPLTGYDRSILPGLLADPYLEDVRDHLELIATSGDKGDFEQESLGRPDLPYWPFYHMMSEDPDCGTGAFLMG